jgi:hypothetical protein
MEPKKRPREGFADGLSCITCTPHHKQRQGHAVSGIHNKGACGRHVDASTSGPKCSAVVPDNSRPMQTHLFQ